MWLSWLSFYAIPVILIPRHGDLSETNSCHSTSLKFVWCSKPLCPTECHLLARRLLDDCQCRSIADLLALISQSWPIALASHGETYLISLSISKATKSYWRNCSLASSLQLSYRGDEVSLSGESSSSVASEWRCSPSIRTHAHLLSLIH